MKNVIHKTAIIHKDVIIGEGNVIGPFCVIGYPAEMKGVNSKGKVIIGNNNIITGLVTIDSGTKQDTIIGNNCYIMKHAHVGHDAVIGSEVTLSCGVKIGGHADIRNKSTLGLNAVVHQRCVVPEGCMIGALGFVGKKNILKPFKKYAGVPVKEIGENTAHPEYNIYQKETL